MQTLVSGSTRFEGNQGLVTLGSRAIIIDTGRKANRNTEPKTKKITSRSLREVTLQEHIQFFALSRGNKKKEVFTT